MSAGDRLIRGLEIHTGTAGLSSLRSARTGRTHGREIHSHGLVHDLRERPLLTAFSPVITLSNGKPDGNRQHKETVVHLELSTPRDWVYTFSIRKYVAPSEGLFPWHRRCRCSSSTISTGARPPRP